MTLFLRVYLMSNPRPEELLIGAHTSAAGGVWNALYEGQEIGATTIQLFTANQKRWEGKDISDEDVEKWEEALAVTGIKEVMSHDSYLINLGSCNPEILEKSHHTFKAEIKRCHKLKLAYLNFHPGAATEGTEEECLNQIVQSLLSFESLVAKGSTRLLLEATAGQGTAVGHRFEHLAYIIEKVKDIIPIGVCIDTCHIFAAGYDIRTEEGWDKTLKEFDKVVGLKHLYALHVNDSMKPFGSRKDRHALLGEGEIGWECFHVMMKDKRLRLLPKYLETPDPACWKKEIKKLRELAST